MRTEFQEKVRQIVRNIPQGKVLSYKQVAEAAGYPGAFRAVGTVMRNNHDKTVPCHRVIKADGTPGGYNGGEKEKELRLRAEGAKVDTGAEIKYTITRKIGDQN